MKRIPFRLVAVLLFFPMTGLAAPPTDRRPPPPPPEAIEACVDLEEGDACSFEHDEHEVQGECMPGPKPELPLACRPPKPPRGE